MAERPAWLADPIRTRVGVAVIVTDASVPLIHAGLVYWEPKETPRMVHLAFHAIVMDDPLPQQSHKLFWSELLVNDEAAAAIAGMCRRVAKRRPPIKYGIVYEGGKLSNEGEAILYGQAVGLTCATFVLALLSTFNHDLLALDTWPSRETDEPWHRHIVAMLVRFRQQHPDKLTEEHIDAVRRERGCARFRPEEVCAAAQLDWPADFSTVEPLGSQARAFLLTNEAGPLPNP